MNHKIKLFIAIFTFSIIGLGFFGLIAYDSAVNASYERESTLLKNFTKHFVHEVVEDIGGDEKNITQEKLSEWLDHHQNAEFILAVLEQEKNILSVIDSRNQSQYFITRLIKNEIIGSRSLEDHAYTWYSVKIADTPYYVSIIHKISADDAGSYFKSLGVPLIMTAILLLWLTIWVTLYIANLYEKINDRKNELEYQSNHDELTGLINRKSFLDELKLRVATAKEKKQTLSLCYLNVDNLKNINQTLGLQYGDDLLIDIAKRCVTIIGDKGVVARLGAAEFAIILWDIDLNVTRKMANQILKDLEGDIAVNNVKLNISPNIGITLFPEHGESAGELIQRTEIAIINAKKLDSRLTIFHDDLLDHYSPDLKLISLK